MKKLLKENETLTQIVNDEISPIYKPRFSLKNPANELGILIWTKNTNMH